MKKHSLTFFLLLFNSFLLLAQETNCGDGIDNDGDGFVDCFDSDCYGLGDCNSSADGYFYGLLMDTCPAIFDKANPDAGLKYGWTTPAMSDFPGGLGNPFVIGDLDKDGVSEIVIGIRGDTLAIFDGKTGQIKRKLVGYYFPQTVGVLADVNNDGYGDIICKTDDSIITAYDYFNNTVIWIATQSPMRVGNQLKIADFNGDGVPEIFDYHHVWNSFDGSILGEFSFAASSIWLRNVAVDVLPSSSCADCGGLELVLTPNVYSIDIVGASITSTLRVTCDSNVGGVNAIADIDNDGALDIVSSNPDMFWTWNPRTGAVYNSVEFTALGLPKTGPLSNTPSVYKDENGKFNYVLTYASETDFFAGINHYLLSLDESLNLNWAKQHFGEQHWASNPTVFDLDGDGKKEIIARPDGNSDPFVHWYLGKVYVLDAATGNVRDSIWCMNGTAVPFDGKVEIADVDGDGQVEIISAGSSMTFGHSLMTIESCTNDWVCGRTMWNQLDYHPAFINDDLTVPRMQQNHALVNEINEYGNQVPFRDVLGNYNCPLPDVVPTIQTYNYVGCDTIDVSVEFCNIGTVKVPGLECTEKFVSFYSGDPRTGGSILLSDTFHYNLGPDTCALKTFRMFKGVGSIDLYVFANDSGTIPLMAPVTNFTECKTQNNDDNIRVENVVPALITAAKDTLCFGDSVQMQASGGVSYLWTPNTDLDDDTLSNPTTTSPSSITYTVTVTDSIGCMNDTNITIVIDSGILVTSVFASDTIICLGSSTFLTATGGLFYTWIPASSLDDSARANPIANPIDTTIYQVIIAGSCTEDTQYITIDVIPFPIANAGSDTALCLGDSTQLQASGIGFYQWVPSTGLSNPLIANPIARPLVTTAYTLRVDNNNCIDSATVNVSINLPPTISLSRDTTICTGNSVSMSVSGATTYLWSPDSALSDATSENPIASPTQTRTYNVLGIANCGTDSGSLEISVNSCSIYIPNAFSHNGDGENDVFRMRGDGIDHVTMRIYNRWGVNVYQTKDALNEGWDGYVNGVYANEGVYVYQLLGTFIDGNPIDMKGNFTLVR